MNNLDIKISCFENVTGTTARDVSLLAWLRSDKYRAKVEMIRGLKDEDDQKAIKKTLPCITPSGRFSYRNEKGLIEHSGYLAFDIDFQDNTHISNFDDLKDQVSHLKNVAYCGLSVRGKGFWGLVPIPISTPEEHRNRFIALSEAFKSFRINLDPTGKDVTRLRIYSWDPEPHINPDASLFNQIHTPPPKPAPKYDNPTAGDNKWKVEGIIKNLCSVDITGDYHQWFAIGCSLANEFGEAGRGYFHEISRHYSKYDPTETDLQYSSCLKTSYGWSISTLFYHAENHGILFKKDPKSEPEKKPIKTEAPQDLARMAAERIGQNNHMPAEKLKKDLGEGVFSQMIQNKVIAEALPGHYYLPTSTPF